MTIITLFAILFDRYDEEDVAPGDSKLLVKTRSDMEPEFNAERNKKSFLWGKVNEEIKKVKPEYLMTKDQVSRCGIE